MELLTLEILEWITSAAYGHKRRQRLMDINDGLNRLRVLLRLAHEMQTISHKHYAEVAKRLGLCGRLLGAWMQREGLQRASAATALQGVEP